MENDPSKLATGLAWCGLIVMTTLVMIRTMVEHDAFPMWMSDPFVFSPPVIGLTPMKALMLNLSVTLCAAVFMLGLMLRNEQIGIRSAFLLIFGVAIITHHGFHTSESAIEGSNMLAIVSVLFAASCAHKIGGAQQLIGAITISFAVLLTSMGAYEMFVTHPNTVANYEHTRESFLAARGWAPHSFEALAYERRLYQAEPIVWFGLTNVFASFAGACSAGLLIFGWCLRKTDRLSIISLMGGLIAMGGLVMTGAKGGIGAFGLGLGLTVVALVCRRWKLDGQAIVIMCGLVILGVITRGFIGERIGELSLLFRSQYMVGAMRMFFGDPLFGVGPGAFQDHYATVKPALSPEDVASAHSFGFDFIATLGLGGVALVALFVSILSRIRPCQELPNDESLLERRQVIQITLLIIAIASVVSIRFGSPAMDTNLFLVQSLASLAWAGLAYVLVRTDNVLPALRWAMFAAAAVLAIHSMIEVTASWMVSGMLWALIVGNACTSTGTDTGLSKLKISPKPALAAVALMLLGSAVVFGMRLPNIAQWEHHIEEAAEPAVEIAYQRQELGGQVSPELNQLEFDGRSLAIERLIEAAAIRPSHMPTRIAASQQMLWKASVLDSLGRHADSQAIWDQALDLLETGAQSSTGASGYQWLGSVWFGRAMQFPEDPAHDVWLGHAQRAWMEASVRSPRNPHLVVKMMDLAIEQGLEAAATDLAKQALKLHEQSRLDPLRGLEESELMRVRGIARESE